MMANKDKAMHEQPGLERRPEITNTGGRLDHDPSEDASAQTTDRGDAEYPVTAGRKSGDDAWHDDANRSGDRGENAEPMRGGNMRR
jgi:hypothetical protein